MPAYLKFFELEESPFEGKSQTQVVLGTRALRDAYALIRAGLDEGDARICVSGGPGLGKTSLARALPKLLGKSARVAIVLDPDVSWESLRGSISKQWGIETGGLGRATLVEAARDRRLVLVIDQAERASEEFLDHLDIVLCYRSESDEPVVQSILLARLSGNDRPEPAPLLWWLDRIHTRQLEFAPLPCDGIESYIRKHLERAGWQGERLFTNEAALAIHEHTGGVPGEVSRLCERLLAEAAARDRHDIDATFVHSLCGKDEEASGIEDEFEEIVLAEEFDDTGSTSESEPSPNELQETVAQPVGPPTRAETLEDFETDDALAERDDALSAPASPEELRAILGSAHGRFGRAFAAAAIAALIGGLALAWLARDPRPSEPITAGRSERAGPGPPDSAEARSTANSQSTPAVLARLRGPVATIGTTTNPSPAASNRKNAPEFGEGKDDQIPDEDFDEELSEDDLIDMRPAAMIPGSPENLRSEQRFW